MRTGLLLFFLLFSGRTALAQPGVFRLDSLPTRTLTLPVAWRWHPGDNPTWAAPTLDDSRWDTVQPSRKIRSLPQLAGAGIHWFRLRLEVSARAADQPLPVYFFLNGAADVYLDGTLFCHLGQIGDSSNNYLKYKRIRGDLHLLPGLAAGAHSLAVRLATRPDPWYVPRFSEDKQTLRIEIDPPEQFGSSLAGNTHADTWQTYLVVGLFLMLAGIHFLYYLYRRRAINLIFGATMLLFCLGAVATNGADFARNLTLASWLQYVGTLASMGYAVLLLATYYTYLERKRGWLFWGLAAYALLMAVASGVPLTSKSAAALVTLTQGLATFLLFLDGFRISLLAIRDREYKAVLVLVSGAVLVGVLVVTALIVSVLLYFGLVTGGGGAGNVPIFSTILSISVPVVLAILLAKEHDQTNRDLQHRLADVEKLSAEKQGLLTQQNELLEQRVAKRTAKLNQSLQDLRATQTQLVQREKMASLGELTAGIAHEIQNPLNFVNNFADLSAELLDELKQEQNRPQPTRDPALETELLNDIHLNVSKIAQHGQRAASIVRGMLQHARSSTGERELTDLNRLGDEYLRLSYQGMRRLDTLPANGPANASQNPPPRFNATLHTSLDPLLEPVNVVSQEISRVLLNLFNNAFYAVWEKARTSPEGYFPTVWFTTRQLPDGVSMEVKDNGTGIPEAMQHKIFQPFFTTKPTGQGTGLGLSLSFDIITKGHGGTLSVESIPGQQTTFSLWLPTPTRT